jgi:hypothetical protein
VLKAFQFATALKPLSLPPADHTPGPLQSLLASGEQVMRTYGIVACINKDVCEAGTPLGRKSQ